MPHCSVGTKGLAWKIALRASSVFLKLTALPQQTNTVPSSYPQFDSLKNLLEFLSLKFIAAFKSLGQLNIEMHCARSPFGVWQLEEFSPVQSKPFLEMILLFSNVLPSLITLPNVFTTLLSEGRFNRLPTVEEGSSPLGEGQGVVVGLTSNSLTSQQYNLLLSTS